MGVVSARRSGGRGKHLDTLVQRAGLPPDERLAVRAVAAVLPFRPSRYEAVPGELPGLFPREPDEPGELMVPAI